MLFEEKIFVRNTILGQDVWLDQNNCVYKIDELHPHCVPADEQQPIGSFDPVSRDIRFF